MVKIDNEETFEGQTDPSSCPDEDRSWKRRQKTDHLTDRKTNLDKDVGLDPTHGNNTISDHFYLSLSNFLYVFSSEKMHVRPS